MLNFIKKNLAQKIIYFLNKGALTIFLLQGYLDPLLSLRLICLALIIVLQKVIVTLRLVTLIALLLFY